MESLDLCVLFTCYFLLRNFYDFYNANLMLLSYLLHMESLDLCVLFTCYFLLRNFYDFYNANLMLLLYLIHNANACTQ